MLMQWGSPSYMLNDAHPAICSMMLAQLCEIVNSMMLTQLYVRLLIQWCSPSYMWDCWFNDAHPAICEIVNSMMLTQLYAQWCSPSYMRDYYFNDAHPVICSMMLTQLYARLLIQWRSPSYMWNWHFNHKGKILPCPHRFTKGRFGPEILHV